MRPSESGNIILENLDDYDLLHPAGLLGGFKDYWVDDFGNHHWIDYSKYGLETKQIVPRFAPLDPERPVVELPIDLSRDVIRGLFKMEQYKELVVDLGFDAHIIPIPEDEDIPF